MLCHIIEKEKEQEEDTRKSKRQIKNKRERTHQLLQTVKKRGHDVFVEIGARRHGLGVVGSGLHGEQGERMSRGRGRFFPWARLRELRLPSPSLPGTTTTRQVPGVRRGEESSNGPNCGFTSASKGKSRAQENSSGLSPFSFLPFASLQNRTGQYCSLQARTGDIRRSRSSLLSIDHLNALAE